MMQKPCRLLGLSFICLGLITAMLGGCKSQQNPSSVLESSSAPDTGFPVSIGGVTIQKEPQRVAVLSPSLAEIAVDMGYTARLCARAEECDAPADIASLPSVGSLWMINIDSLKEINPDLVLMQSEPNDTVKAFLHKAGIPLAIVPAASRYDELEKMYRTLGKLFDGSIKGEEKGQMQMLTIEQGLTAIRDKVKEHTQAGTPNVLYITDAYGHVATGDTLIHTLLESAGTSNAAAADTQWNAQEQTLAKADIILCPQGQKAAVLSNKKLASSPAVKQKKVYELATAPIERQGSRMIDAVRIIAETLYPDAFKTETTTSQTDTSSSAE